MYSHYDWNVGDFMPHTIQMARLDSIAGQFSDAPEMNGMSSACMKQILLEADLGDLDLFFRYRGVRTFDAMRSLTPNQQSVLSAKAYDFFEALGFYRSDLQNKLDYLFGCPPTSEPFLRDHIDPYPLTHLDSDTKVKKELGAALYNAQDIYGWDNYCACTLKLRRGRELIKAACMEVATGLSYLAVDKSKKLDKEKKELLKDAKRAMRNVLFWYCTGSEGGLDSRDALDKAFKESIKHICCDENTGPDLLNAYHNIMVSLTGDCPGRKDKAAAASGSNDPSEPSSPDPMKLPFPLALGVQQQMAQMRKSLESLEHDMKYVKGKLASNSEEPHI